MVYLFYGTNTFAMRQKLREVIAQYKEKSGSDFGLERFDATETEDPERIINSLISVPFLANSRLVIIEDLTHNKELAEKVIEELDRVPDSTIVVVYEQNPDRRTKVFKDLTNKAQTAEFKELNEPQLIAWTVKTAQESEAKISKNVARFLVEYAGKNQWRLYHEIKKLSNYSSDITETDIQELVKPSSEQTVFNLIDALSQGEIATALKHYRGLREDQQQPLYVLTMLGWHIQNLLLAATWEGTSQELSKQTGISPFVANKSFSQIRGVSLESLKKALASLLAADLQIKTTRSNPDSILEQLIYELSNNLNAT